jgi:hypothetical protein
MRPTRTSPSGTCARASRRGDLSFSGRDDNKTISENFDLAFLGRLPAIAWEREVRMTTAARLKNADPFAR